MTPSDLVALVARLRAFTASYSEMQACAAAIEQLQAELADCHRVITIWDASDLKARPAVEQYARAERAETERDALRAELAAVKADAERYRWLRSLHAPSVTKVLRIWSGPPWDETSTLWWEHGADEAVDAARAQAGGK